MSVYVRFSHEKTAPIFTEYGPYSGVQLSINELWILDRKGEALRPLAEYDTCEGYWSILGLSGDRRYSHMTIASDPTHMKGA